MQNNQQIIFGLSRSLELAKKVSKQASILLGEVEKLEFKDGEILVKPVNTVRGKDVFIIQSTSKPVNDSIMELLIFIDACTRASARSISLVIPYFGYARQDRKSKVHEPITSKLIAKLISTLKVERVITFDLHCPQIEGFFDVPVDNLNALPTLCNHIVNKQLKNLVVVSPDQGGVVRARKLAESLNTSLAIIDKRRHIANKSEVMNILGDVENKNCLLIDDMIDTGGTIINAANALKSKGANKIYVACTHGLFNGDAVEKFNNASSIDNIITTDTITLDKKIAKLEVITISDFLADVIKAIIESKPIGSVYKEHTKVLPTSWN